MGTSRREFAGVIVASRAGCIPEGVIGLKRRRSDNNPLNERLMPATDMLFVISSYARQCILPQVWRRVKASSISERQGR